MTTQAALRHDDEPATGMQARFAYAMRAKIRRRQTLHILLAEDDDSDVMLTECALDKTYIHHNLHRVKNGDEALQYLRREGTFAAATPPDLILLDLSLPAIDGFEVLAALTQEARFSQTPIIILTGAEHYRHLLNAHGLWLSDYLAKPCNPEKLLETFGKLHSPG
ncbi:MAG: response regulator [Pseudomonadota bacterium]|nr:response regulator [Pseudomonadota bacterium]MDE3037825.1 response regulator [Pseudomonadota bacterium]